MGFRHGVLAAVLAATPAFGSTMSLSDNNGDPLKVTVAPGQTFTVNVLMNTDVEIYGHTYYLFAGTSGLFSIVGRTIDPSNPFSDPNASDSAVLAVASALLNPENDNDLGGTATGIDNIQTGNYTLGTISLAVDAAAPQGTYTIVTSTGSANDIFFNEYDIADSAAYEVTVAVPEPASLAVIGLAGLVLGRRRMA